MKIINYLAVFLTITSLAVAEESGTGNEKKPLEKQLLGYWAPDMKAMDDDMKKMAKELAIMTRGRSGKEAVKKAEQQIMKELTIGYGTMFAVEFKEGEMFLLILDDVDEDETKRSYTIKEHDDKTRTLKLEFTNDNHKTMMKAEFKGDLLFLVEHKVGKEDHVFMKLMLSRIDEEAFKKRQKATAEFNKDEAFKRGQKPTVEVPKEGEKRPLKIRSTKFEKSENGQKKSESKYENGVKKN